MYHGADGDFRNLWRRGSGMTLRRLWVLIRGLPPEAWVRAEMDAAQRKAEEAAKVAHIRDRTAHYARQREGTA